MRIFNYDHPTGRYLGAGQADPNPMRPGDWLLPAFSTDKEPPTVPPGSVAVFDPQADAWSVQPLPPAQAAREVAEAAAGTPASIARAQRDALMLACDWVTGRAFEHGERVPEAWATYRQALRDVPQQEGFPDSINWPEAPAA